MEKKMKQKTNLILILAAIVAAMWAPEAVVAGLDPNTFGNDATIWKLDSSFSSTAYYGESRELVRNSITNGAGYLILGTPTTGGGVNSPVFTTGGGGHTGLPGDEALVFNGTTSVAHSLDGHQVWNNSWEDFQIEFYFKPDRINGTAQEILIVQGCWGVRLEEFAANQARLRVQLWQDEGSQLWANSHIFDNSVIGQWNHAMITSIDGEVNISVNGEPCAQTAQYQQLPTSVNRMVYVGRNVGDQRHYQGALDDITISEWVWHDFLAPYEDTSATQLLLHFDEVNDSVTPDDNSANPTRANDGILQGDVSLSANTLNSQFGNSLLFNGGAVEAGRTGVVDMSNIRVEFWAKMEREDEDTGSRVLFFLPTTLRVQYQMMTGNTWRLFYEIWTPDGTYKKITITYLAQSLVSQWNHYAFEFEDGVQRIFINGDLQLEGSASDVVLRYPDSNIWIGRESNQRPYYGYIDEVKVSKINLECGDLGYLPGDLNQDCIVDTDDLELFVSEWLQEN